MEGGSKECGGVGGGVGEEGAGVGGRGGVEGGNGRPEDEADEQSKGGDVRCCVPAARGKVVEGYDRVQREGSTTNAELR